MVAARGDGRRGSGRRVVQRVETSPLVTAIVYSCADQNNGWGAGSISSQTNTQDRKRTSVVPKDRRR